MTANMDAWTIAGRLGLIAAAAAVFCAVLIFALHPLLVRYALARPNARSSHRDPTPQGGGIAVISATIIAIIGAAILAPDLLNDRFRLTIVLACVVGLAAIGAIDDVYPLDALPRLLFQAVMVLGVIATLPFDFHVIDALPWWLERALMFVAVLWFVNLVNFMDGIDLMTVAEVVPVTVALALFGLTGALPRDATLVSFALCGAVIGFAPFNRPVAKLFLGDVGSLPIGLLLGWLLLVLAGNGHLVAALLLPLYYLADSTVTLFHRLVKGESVLLAHRGHFYQRAMDGGLEVHRIVGLVFAVNILLAVFAALTVFNSSLNSCIAAAAGSSVAVGALLWTFNNKYRLSKASH